MVSYPLSLLIILSFSSANEEESDKQEERKVENRNLMDYFVLYPNEPPDDKPLDMINKYDDFLYPPRSYYIHWINSERKKDWEETMHRPYHTA